MRMYKLFGLLCLLALAATAVYGCKPRGAAEVDTRTAVYLGDIEADCLARCERSGDYGSLTHGGCVYGCQEISRTFDLGGRVYSDWGRCEEAVSKAGGDNFLADYDEMCMTYSYNIHRQGGCLDAVRFYLADLNPAAVCRPLSPEYSGGPGVSRGIEGRNLTK